MHSLHTGVTDSTVSPIRHLCEDSSSRTRSLVGAAAFLVFEIR
jgi:hypothetical protein